MGFDADNLRKARGNLKRRMVKQRAVHLALHARALGDFESILKMIVGEYHPKKVYQWGSLLRPERFRDYSDIDIAIEGAISPDAYFEMLGKAQAMTEFPVDIVQLEKIEPEFAESIRTEGKVVYERAI
ncbi:MAG: nucleotidyltransferase domain-containing protein [Deltaproteobacteria bacterium]|nr:nucleotidyltransferase domain-containing protein [Deltaproteobacteria bacterium]